MNNYARIPVTKQDDFEPARRPPLVRADPRIFHTRPLPQEASILLRLYALLGGRKAVTTTIGKIAEGLVSPRSAQRAIAGLRAKGLIRTRTERRGLAVQTKFKATVAPRVDRRLTRSIPRALLLYAAATATRTGHWQQSNYKASDVLGVSRQSLARAARCLQRAGVCSRTIETTVTNWADGHRTFRRRRRLKVLVQPRRPWKAPARLLRRPLGWREEEA